MVEQTAHEAEAAALRASVEAAQEECGAASARADSDAAAHAAAAEQLRGEAGALAAKCAALETSLGARQKPLIRGADTLLYLGVQHGMLVGVCNACMQLALPTPCLALLSKHTAAGRLGQELLAWETGVVQVCCLRLRAGETQACAEAAAGRVTFLEEQIGAQAAEAEAAAAQAETALAAARGEAAEQLAALRAMLAATQVRPPVALFAACPGLAARC